MLNLLRELFEGGPNAKGVKNTSGASKTPPLLLSQHNIHETRW